MDIDYKDAKAVLEVCDKATEGPWVTNGITVDNWHNTTMEMEWMANGADDNKNSKNDANFIALARTALPYWVQRAVEAESENAALRADNAGLVDTLRRSALVFGLVEPHKDYFDVATAQAIWAGKQLVEEVIREFHLGAALLKELEELRAVRDAAEVATSIEFYHLKPKHIDDLANALAQAKAGEK